MKNRIIAFVIGAMLLIPIVTEAENLITAMRVKDPNGNNVTVTLDACYDPVTKRWEPCYVMEPVCINNVKK